MKNSMEKLFRSFLWIGIFAVVLAACVNDDVNPLTTSENAGLAAKENSQIVAVTEDVMDITDGIFVSRGMTGGRTAGGPGHDGHDDDEDDHDGDDDHIDSLGCKPSISGSFHLDRSHSDSLIYTGTFVVDYGYVATCADSINSRRGKVMDSITLIISFGDSIKFTSTETITFEGFYKDSTQLDGTFIIKSSTGNPTTVEAQDAMITYADGTSFSWDGTLTFVYEKDGSRHCEGKTMKITEGSIEGTTREGAVFATTIIKEIVFKRGCHGRHSSVPVSGTVEVVTAGVSSTIDYGDGSCDKDFTITTAGITTEHSQS
jgi:hypothetical protein